MASAEGPCYTIINSPELTEVYNEMKLKKDLGKYLEKKTNIFYSEHSLTPACVHRTTRR